MDTVRVSDLPALFQGVADIFEEQKDHLCEMDAAMGDGDLGLTMSKGYGALPGLIKDQMQETSVAKTLMKAAMKMQGLVPSTMGTLMSRRWTQRIWLHFWKALLQVSRKEESASLAIGQSMILSRKQLRQAKRRWRKAAA